MRSVDALGVIIREPANVKQFDGAASCFFSCHAVLWTVAHQMSATSQSKMRVGSRECVYSVQELGQDTPSKYLAIALAGTPVNYYYLYKCTSWCWLCTAEDIFSTPVLLARPAGRSRTASHLACFACTPQNLAA